jgi:hypothetical protein
VCPFFLFFIFIFFLSQYFLNDTGFLRYYYFYYTRSANVLQLGYVLFWIIRLRTWHRGIFHGFAWCYVCVRYCKWCCP